MNKQNENGLIHAENKLVVAAGKRVKGLDERGEGIGKYKLIAAEWSWNVMYGKGGCSQWYFGDRVWCQVSARLIGGLLRKLYRCLAMVLYTRN